LKLNFQYRRIFQLFITTNIAEMKFNKWIQETNDWLLLNKFTLKIRKKIQINNLIEKKMQCVSKFAKQINKKIKSKSNSSEINTIGSQFQSIVKKKWSKKKRKKKH
jgi:hypothetical protein